MVAVADRGGGISSISGECFSFPSYHLGGAERSDSEIGAESQLKEEIEIEMERKVKEETAEILEEDGGGGGCSARAMEGLQEAVTPPFLKKTFQMVDDPETDPVVSWSEGRESFVVWDSHEFSKRILPRNFKHSNFSSFVRQLNTYGFRKVDPDRWEFANEGFQGGKKHLLRTIKRRTKPSPDPNLRSGVESDIDALKTDQNRIESELQSLVRRQQEAEQRLMAVEDRIRFSETRQNQTLRFLIKSVMNPSFVRNLIRRRGLEDGAGDRKRQRAILPAAETGESFGSGDSGVFSVGDFVSESVLDDICVDLDEDLIANDSEVYHDWDGFMTGLVDQSGQCSELMLG